MLDVVLLIALLAGLLPAVLFTYSYAAHSAWRSTPAGRAIMSIMVVTVLTFGSGALTLAFPEFFRAPGGIFVRIVLRLAVAAVLWNLYLVLRKSQRFDREELERERTER